MARTYEYPEWNARAVRTTNPERTEYQIEATWKGEWQKVSLVYKIDRVWMTPAFWMTPAWNVCEQTLYEATHLAVWAWRMKKIRSEDPEKEFEKRMDRMRKEVNCWV